MVIRRAGPETDQAARSLLQKAVRRGNTSVAAATFRYLAREKNELAWLRSRLAVMTFEEAWPYGVQVTFGRSELEILGHYRALCGSSKNKDAAGLGSLAYALSSGDATALAGDEGDWYIRVVARAAKERAGFWEWVQAEAANAGARVQTLVGHALEGSKKAGWPWDKAFTFAAALLGIRNQIPVLTRTGVDDSEPFPYWVAIDKHTPQGKQIIRSVAAEMRVRPSIALWLSFYLESATCSRMEPAPWWEREKRWRFAKLGVTELEGTEIWVRLRPLIAERLGPTAEELERLVSRYREPVGPAEEPSTPTGPKQLSLFE